MCCNVDKEVPELKSSRRASYSIGHKRRANQASAHLSHLVQGDSQRRQVELHPLSGQRTTNLNRPVGSTKSLLGGYLAPVLKRLPIRSQVFAAAAAAATEAALETATAVASWLSTAQPVVASGLASTPVAAAAGGELATAVRHFRHRRPLLAT